MLFRLNCIITHVICTLILCAYALQPSQNMCLYFLLIILLQLSSVTEERNHLKNAVDQLKQQKNVDAGASISDGTVQVVGYRSH